MDYYDRYEQFRNGGVVERPPFLPIVFSDTDLLITFDKNKMRMDNLSYKYYGDANFGWLILQANPHLGGYEYNIPDGVSLRIPYPLSSAITRYERSVQNYIEAK